MLKQRKDIKMPLALQLIVLEGSCRLKLGLRVSDCLQRRTIWIAEVDVAQGDNQRALCGSSQPSFAAAKIKF
jgi:hypothetical protein